MSKFDYDLSCKGKLQTYTHPNDKKASALQILVSLVVRSSGSGAENLVSISGPSKSDTLVANRLPLLQQFDESVCVSKPRKNVVAINTFFV